MEQQIIALYLVCINITAFSVFGLDKYKARKNRWRIKESTLFLLCYIGGAIGAVIAMQLWRHKTTRKKFYIGVPLIAILQIIIFFIIATSKPHGFSLISCLM